MSQELQSQWVPSPIQQRVLRGPQQAIARILADPRTVYWTYTPTEWQRFTTQAWHRSIRQDLIGTGFACGLLLVLVLPYVGFEKVSTGGLDVGTLSSAMAFAIGLPVIVGLVLFVKDAWQWRWRRRQTILDVYLHPTGFIMCDWYTSIRTLFEGFKRITYKTGDPGVLALHIGSGRSSRRYEVPVPSGREAEAAYVA